jgi:membrane protein DedA with SNARE-associated domain
MSLQAFMLILCGGAGLLALWIDIRFPRFAPPDLMRAAIRIVVAFAIGYLVAPVLTLAVGAGMSPAAALMLLVLPALVLFFLTAIWMMRALQAMLPGLYR